MTLDGHDYYLGPWDSPESKVEYTRLIAEWTANSGTLIPPNRKGALSIAEILAAYLDFAKGYYVRKDGKTSRELSGMKQAIRPVKELYAHFKVRDFGPQALKAVRQKMIDLEWCRTHTNRQVNRVRRVFKWGVENEIVPPEVLQALQALSPLKRGRTEVRKSEPVKPVRDELVQAILQHTSRQVATMIQLQQLTGMRTGEVVKLRPCDIDTSNKVWVYVLEEHKTAYRGHRREVYFGPRAQLLLAPWLDRSPWAYCFSPAEAEAERNAKRRNPSRAESVATRRRKIAPKRPKRDHYDTDSYRRAINYAITKAGVQHWHPHQLRHSCATRIRNDFSLDAAQVILGHRSADVTQVYAEADRAKALDVVARIG